MSFPIIENLGGQEVALGILSAAGYEVTTDAIRMWKGRGMPSRAQLIFTNKALDLGIAYGPSDFTFQPDAKAAE